MSEMRQNDEEKAFENHARPMQQLQLSSCKLS